MKGVLILDLHRPGEEFCNCAQESKGQNEEFKGCLERYWKLVDKKKVQNKTKYIKILISDIYGLK